MATRFYLPSSGTPPLSSLAKDATWEQETGLVRLPTFISKTDKALTTSSRTWASASTQQWCWYQFQSEQLAFAYSWTTAETVAMVLGKMAETTTSGDSHLCYVIRVVSADGTTQRGIIGTVMATSSEIPLIASAATRIHNTVTTGATNFSSQKGDRIIIEIGLHGVTPAIEVCQMRVGDPIATSDFALTAALTTDLCSWVQIAKNVVLASNFCDETNGITETSDASIVYGGITNETSAITDSPSAVQVSARSQSEGGSALYQDNFQSYSAGNLVGQGNWVNGNNGTDIQVVDVSGDKRVYTANNSRDGFAYLSGSFPNDH